MIKKSLLVKIYEAAGMQRWNDQIRTIELFELDKQAHKMIVAYILGKSEQDMGKEVDWIKIIECGLFGFLKRIILTDLKPPLIYRIKEDRLQYEKLNRWVFERISPFTKQVGKNFNLRFKEYLLEPKEEIEKKIVNGAHFYVTKWEFEIIKSANTSVYLAEEIEDSLSSEQAKYNDLRCMRNFIKSKDLLDFANICGQLRFQQRWSHIYRVPKTSVLGHMLIVAIFSLLFSYTAGLREENCINNYFTGLFHDLPEVLTRDIINPVKKSVKGLDELIKDYEIEEMEKKIFKLVPEGWQDDIRMYTEDEFSETGRRNGKLVKGADDLAAFIEAYLALKNGIRNESLIYAKKKLIQKYRNKIIDGVKFGEIYTEFT